MNYYYLISSLPYLEFDKKTPIPLDDFVAECAKWFSDRELDIIKKSNIDEFESASGDLQTIKTWKDFNRSIKEELAGVREAKRAGTTTKTTSIFSDIFAADTPLLMEKRFEQIRWIFLEQLEACYVFDINWLIIYSYKLQILERLAVFNKEEGWKVFHDLCSVTIAPR